MATYNYNNGNYSYGYSNGNYSSQTTVVNGVAYTRNITNIGGSCGGDNTCVDGYSLYFPCIKNITRGQNVCFDFYVGDNANQDELDIRDLDELTLSLSGIFGCEYGTYTYPDDITSLQTEDYREILFEDFNSLTSNICELKMKYFDETGSDVEPNVSGKVGKFYIGTEVVLVADDTPDHIFVCWGKPHEFEYDELCDITIDGIDYDVITINKEYRFNINEDTELYAVYRKRKEYEVRVSFDNRHSHFEVYYNDERHYLSDKVRDVVKIKENYKFKAICIPNESTIGKIQYKYIFIDWSDGYQFQSRELVADDDNQFIENNSIVLRANCKKIETETDLNIINYVATPNNDYEVRYPEENVLFTNTEYVDFTTNDNIIESKNAKIAYFSDYNGMLYLDNGYIKTNLLDIEDGVKVVVKVKSDEDCVINIEVNGESIPYNVDGTNSDINEYVFECLFRKCNNSFVKISSEGALYIDEIYVYEEIIENKGLVQLCLSPEDTANMYTGPLYATGAISVGGNIYGIDKTLMGNINNLKTINVL